MTLNIRKNIVVASLLLIVIMLTVYILTTRSTGGQKMFGVIPVTSTTTPHQNPNLNIGTSTDVVSRVTIANTLARDEKWEIVVKILSIDEQYTLKEKKWITEGAIFYHQTLQGNAADFEERKTEIVHNFADMIASSSAKRNYQTLVSEEVIRLGQFRDSLLTSKRGQTSSLQSARTTYTGGSANYSPRAVAELLDTFPTLIDILNEELVYIDYLIRVDKKILESVNMGDAELTAIANLDDMLLRKIALWHESAYNNILQKQGNLQMELVSENLQSLSDTLNALAAQASTTETTPN